MAKLLKLAAQKLTLPEFEGASTFGKNAKIFKDALAKDIDQAQGAMLRATAALEGDKLANEVRTIFEDFSRKSTSLATNLTDLDLEANRAALKQADVNAQLKLEASRRAAAINLKNLSLIHI